ncbi:MAG: response regulator [Ardenticatenaceae bacterium]|nr:response regulator [Anaerolineales bacterium]MCB8918508.1 response regulator [Ardenticatenaceae bacterium]
MAKKRRARILAVDDDEAVLRILEMLLMGADYEVYTATNGIEGLDAVERHKPDLILLDVIMPLLKGGEVCRRLRARPGTAQLPIIMMSSLGEVDDRINGFDAGADDYITKPVNKRELLARIKALLARSEYGRTQMAEVIAIVGAKGGVGVTSLAVNLAVALAQRESRVTLIELQPSQGMLRYHFNIPAGLGLSQLASVTPTDIGWPEIRQCLVTHSSGAKILPASDESPQPRLTSEHIDTILAALTRDVDYVLIDLPPSDEEIVRRVLDSADRILLVTEAEVLSAICARTRLQDFADWGVIKYTSVVGVARVPSGMMLTRLELENEVGLGGQLEYFASQWDKYAADPTTVIPSGLVALIPPAPESFQEAIRVGVPLVQYEPSSRASRAIGDLAAWLLEQSPRH